MKLGWRCGQFGSGPAEGHPSGGQYHRVVGDAERQRRELLDQKHRHAVVGKGTDRGQQPVHDDRGQP
jgi:hypothetical protein